MNTFPSFCLVIERKPLSESEMCVGRSAKRSLWRRKSNTFPMDSGGEKRHKDQPQIICGKIEATRRLPTTRGIAKSQKIQAISTKKGFQMFILFNARVSRFFQDTNQLQCSESIITDYRMSTRGVTKAFRRNRQQSARKSEALMVRSVYRFHKKLQC
jgi:hypothetical protein